VAALPAPDPNAAPQTSPSALPPVAAKSRWRKFVGEALAYLAAGAVLTVVLGAGFYVMVRRGMLVDPPLAPARPVTARQTLPAAAPTAPHATQPADPQGPRR
jgi:hypothetical protein